MPKCLYNGTVLLTFPDWAKDYEFLLIRKDSGNDYHAWYFGTNTEPAYSEASGAVLVPIDGIGQLLYIRKDQFNESTVSAGILIPLANILWSKKDIKNESGKVVFKGSDPVPIPQLNPAALMQGFATMLSLRRNRT